jgi:hypothetical protein
MATAICLASRGFRKNASRLTVLPCDLSKTAIELRRFRDFLVAENPHGLVQLVHLQHFFQNCNRPFFQNPIEHLAVRIADDNDNWQLGIDFLDRSATESAGNWTFP